MSFRYILIGGQAINEYINRLPEHRFKKVNQYRPPSYSHDFDLVNPDADISKSSNYIRYLRRFDSAYLDFTVNSEKQRLMMLSEAHEIVFDPFPVIVLPSYNVEIFLKYVGPIEVHPEDYIKLNTNVTIGNKNINKVATLNTLVATQLNPAAISENRINKVVIAAASDYIYNFEITQDKSWSEDYIIHEFEIGSKRILKGADEIENVVKKVYPLIDIDYLNSIHPNTIISFAFSKNTSDSYKDKNKRTANRIKEKKHKLTNIVSKIDNNAESAINKGLDVLIEGLRS